MTKCEVERFENRLRKRYVEHLSLEENPMLLVIRAHLYVENVLNALLETQVKPIALDTLKPTFARKIDVALNLHLLPKQWVAPVRLLNEFRNRVAHRLFDEIKRTDQSAFFTACCDAGFFASKEGRVFHSRMPFPWLLSICLRALIIALLARLRMVVDKVPEDRIVSIGFTLPSRTQVVKMVLLPILVPHGWLAAYKPVPRKRRK